MKNRTPEEKEKIKKKWELIILGVCFGIIGTIFLFDILAIICKAAGLL